MNIIKLIHWPSLLLVALGLFLVKFTLFNPFTDITLNWVGMIYFCIAVLCIAASGSLVDNLLNHPALNPANGKVTLAIHKTKKTGYRLFFILTILGIGLGFYLANLIERPLFAVLFILASSLLYSRANSLKKHLLLDALIPSSLWALSFISLWLFDLFPAITRANQQMGKFLFNLVLSYAVVIGLLSFFRAVWQRETNENKLPKYPSLSVKFSFKKANYILTGLLVVPIAVILYFLIIYLYKNPLSLFYTLLLIVLPLLIILYQLITAREEHKTKFVLRLMDFALFFTVLSIGLYQLQFLIK